MRTSIKKTDINEVTLRYEELGEMVERVFYMSGKNVMEDGRQVCKGLSYLGDTLRTSGDLIDVIRAEYKAYKKYVSNN